MLSGMMHEAAASRTTMAARPPDLEQNDIDSLFA